MRRHCAAHGDRRERIRHRSHDLASELSSGDLIVVNNSSTLPASVVSDGDLVVHFSTRLPGGLHLVELRRPSGASPLPRGSTSGATAAPGGGTVELLTPYPVGGEPSARIATADLGRPLLDYVEDLGPAHPIPAYRRALSARCLPDDLRSGTELR